MMALRAVLSQAYFNAKSRPTEPNIRHAWINLAESSVYGALMLRQKYDVIETDLERPYDTAWDMFADIDKGLVYISTANSTHPLWTPEQNFAFRLCHDIYGHYAAYVANQQAGFDWPGELNAARWHEKMVPEGLARDALCTEVLGQAAYALTTGKFGEQKVAFL